MTKTPSKLAKKDTLRRVFKDIHDISQFEFELLMDSLSEEEKVTLGLQFVDNEANIKEVQAKIRMSDVYYWPEKDTFVNKGEDGVDELIRLNKVITHEEYIMQEMTKRAHSLKIGDAMRFPLPPIFFKNKGKTPPSVPYLKVAVDSSLEEDTTSLHRLHSKTRPTIK